MSFREGNEFFYIHNACRSVSLVDQSIIQIYVYTYSKARCMVQLSTYVYPLKCPNLVEYSDSL